MKSKKKVKRKVFYLMTALLIFLMTISLLLAYSKKSNESIIALSRQSFEKKIYNALNSTMQKASWRIS